jgi:hypothetical protein
MVLFANALYGTAVYGDSKYDTMNVELTGTARLDVAEHFKRKTFIISALEDNSSPLAYKPKVFSIKGDY